MKQKIIHFIFNLGRGGAETMLVRVIKELPEYEHVVVTLFPQNHFGNELQCSNLICLNLRSLLLLPLALLKFRRLVKSEKPSLIHSHLFWPTVIARLATPKKHPLITTIHAFITTSLEYKKWHIRFLDRFTYKLCNNIIIGVAEGATKEYFSYLGLTPGKAYTLYTFVDVGRFTIENSQAIEKHSGFKVISVGALRQQKNYQWPIKALEKIKEAGIELHIYGSGDMQTELQKQIDSSGARVILKGEVKNIEEVLPTYDLYLMSSTYEGFSLSVLEAMAMGVPLLLSDIASFKEQAADTAVYFSLKNENDLPEKLLHMSRKKPDELKLMADAAKQRAHSFFTLPQHIKGLRQIYTEALKNNS